MAFGRKKEDGDDSGGRYFVDHVPVMMSGKKLLQIALDKGDAAGWKLLKVINSDKHGWILIIWDRSEETLGG